MKANPYPDPFLRRGPGLGKYYWSTWSSSRICVTTKPPPNLAGLMFKHDDVFEIIQYSIVTMMGAI